MTGMPFIENFCSYSGQFIIVKIEGHNLNSLCSGANHGDLELFTFGQKSRMFFNKFLFL